MLKKLIVSGIVLSGLIILTGCAKETIKHPVQATAPKLTAEPAGYIPQNVLDEIDRQMKNPDWHGWGESGDNMRCRVFSDRAYFTSGQAVQISCQVANDSDKPNYIDSYGSYLMEEEKILRSGFEFKLTDQTGREIKSLSQGSFKDNTGRRNLKPKEIIELFATDLNIWYDLSQPGEYVFEVLFLNDHFNRPESIRFRSNKLPIKITAGQTTDNQKPGGFESLHSAVAFIAGCLDKDDYAKLTDACLNNKPYTELLKSLKAIHNKTPLPKLYANRQFPNDKDGYKLGGHDKELGYIHINFIKKDTLWYLNDILMCK